jgi:hypothetical protein
MPEIRNRILPNLKKAKIPGMEIELYELQATTKALEEPEQPAITGPPSAAESGDGHSEATVMVGSRTAEAEIEEVLREATRSPKLGLMILSNKIERAFREHGQVVQYSPSPGAPPIRFVVPPGEVAKARFLFQRVRERIMQSDDADDDEILGSIDSGTRLLRRLLSMPLRADYDE